jgi:ureidoacrylate peracid hydrolase
MIGSRYRKHDRLGFEERIDPASTALVVIDVQNDFALPQGVCGLVGDDISPVAPMIDRLKVLIAAARRANLLIIFMRTIYDDVVLSPTLAEQYARRGYPNSICLTDSHGAEFIDGINPRDAPNEIVLTKHRYSAFWGSAIDLFLRTNGIRTLVLTGIATEVCVESTARDAFFRDYQVVVPADCVGCYSEERQKASLAVLARSFGILAPSADIIAAWQRLGNGPRNWEPQRRAQRQLTTLARKVDPEHTALLLVTGRSGVSPGAPWAGIQDLAGHARRAGCLVVHARPAASAHRAGADPTSGLEIVPCEGEQMVRYHRASAFADTQLEVLLRSNCIRSLIVAGSETNIAVESTVREAFDRDYQAIVPDDCVHTPLSERDLHESSLATMRRHFADVIGSDRIRSSWARAE